MPDQLPQPARMLGFAGLLPQVLFFALVVSDSDRYSFAAQALAFAYAGVIFSFLGGVWWGFAARADQTPAWLWGAAVMPSLIAMASFLPWATGALWPGPSLLVLGTGLVGALLIDRQLVALGIGPPWWMRLRVPLSLGLGGLTIGIGLLA
jgi:hypothetical protein